MGGGEHSEPPPSLLALLGGGGAGAGRRAAEGGEVGPSERELLKLGGWLDAGGGGLCLLGGYRAIERP